MTAISARVVIDADKDPNWPETLKGHLEQKFAGMEAADRRGHNKPPMKNTPEDQAVSDQAYGIAAGELRQFIERAERLEAEIADLKTDLKEVFAEAKGRGFDTRVIRKIIALRKRDRDDVAEEEAILEMYKSALGMA